MNHKQAVAYVLGIAATLVDSDRDQGWIRDDENGEDRNPKDRARIERAIGEVASMLRKKSERLGGGK
jgi:hypothetical protein